MLDILNIEVRYSGVILVLKGVSLKVPEGKIVALLGANGAGKSTTLKAISGLLSTELGKVTDGTIFFEGERIHNKNPQDIVKKGIVQVIEGRAIFEHLAAATRSRPPVPQCVRRPRRVRLPVRSMESKSPPR